MSSAAGPPVGGGARESDQGPRHAAGGHPTLRRGADAAVTSRASAAAGQAQQAVARARHAASTARQAAATQARRSQGERELFAQPVQDYLYHVLGRPLSVLRAGVQTSARELGLDRLRDSGYQITVTTVDQDSELTRAALSCACQTQADQTQADQTQAAQTWGDQTRGASGAGGAEAEAGPVLLGDLRSVPLPPRSFDVVCCAFLLERIPNAALVLDRFVAALRPGGLLLLRIRDRDCADAVLDRSAPEPLRRALWARLHPGEPGPFPAVYDPLTSARGIQAYATAHGLVITRRETARTATEVPVRLAAALRAARTLVRWLSRNQRTDAYDELLYVIRKPEDRFARLV